MIKTNRALPIILMLFSLALHAQKSTSTDCYPIKYLDFFGLDKMEKVTWADAEFDKLMTAEMRDPIDTKTNFLVPMMAAQLKNSSPQCSSKMDATYFNKLLLLYCRIRELNYDSLQNKPMQTNFDFIRDDFYRQVEDEKYLPHMVYTLDDGPFYGINYEKTDSLETIATQQMDFGKLTISKIGNKIILTNWDKNNRRVWQKAITREPNHYLKDLQFKENPISQSSVATVVRMYSQGERFTLYLKNDGKFLYYFHSW